MEGYNGSKGLIGFDQICLLDVDDRTKEHAYYRIVADGSGPLTAENLDFS